MREDVFVGLFGLALLAVVVFVVHTLLAIDAHALPANLSEACRSISQ